MRLAPKIIATLAASLLAVSCATSDKKSGDGDDIGKSGGGKDRGGGDNADKASSNRVTFTNSWSNNPATSQTISDNKAEQEVGHFSESSKDPRVLEGRISAERLARKSANDVLSTARHLAEVEMQKNPNNTVDDEVKLEIALAAVQTRNFSLAEYFLQELTDTKKAKVKAGAFNALGVIALHDDRVPEAVLYFKEALKAVSNYKPALLNLGFTALKGGDLGTAKSALGSMQNDWFVQYGLITVARMTGDDSHADDLCESVLKKEPGHVGALYNCGLYQYQNRKNIAKAKEYLNRAGKAKGGEAGWSEKAFVLISSIDQDEQLAKKEEARKKAEKAAADKAKQAPKGNSNVQPAVEQKPKAQ